MHYVRAVLCCFAQVPLLDSTVGCLLQRGLYDVECSVSPWTNTAHSDGNSQTCSKSTACSEESSRSSSASVMASQLHLSLSDSDSTLGSPTSHLNSRRSSRLQSSSPQDDVEGPVKKQRRSSRVSSPLSACGSGRETRSQSRLSSPELDSMRRTTRQVDTSRGSRSGSHDSGVSNRHYRRCGRTNEPPKRLRSPTTLNRELSVLHGGGFPGTKRLRSPLGRREPSPCSSEVERLSARKRPQHQPLGHDTAAASGDAHRLPPESGEAELQPLLPVNDVDEHGCKVSSVEVRM